MKKAAIAVGLFVVLVVLTYCGVIAIAERGRETIAARWRTLEPDETFAAKFPPVAEKNDVAERLEAAAIPLGIGLMPKLEMDRLGQDAIDAKPFVEVRTAANSWVKKEVESIGDSIGAPPDKVTRYLSERRKGIDDVLAILDEGKAPLWPVVKEGPPALRPIPNYSAQMHLSRILSAAALDAQRNGDGARAWRCERALWTLAKGALSRPELISQLIGVAIVRGVAGVSRKLDGPLPSWFDELQEFDFHRSMLDSCRAEWNASEETIFDDEFIEQLRTDAKSEHADLGHIVRDLAMRPLIRWGTMEMERATVDELLKIAKAEPCDIDSRAISTAIESNASSIARGIAGGYLPSTHTVFSRVANAQIAIEGTAKIVALKERRSSSRDHSWPVGAADLTSSQCSGARWRYTRSEDGSIRFAFDGRVDVPPGFRGYAIPTEYIGAPQ